MKSKYGTIRGTTYGSSRTNIPSSASKTRSLVNAQDGGKPHKAPVQVFTLFFTPPPPNVSRGYGNSQSIHPYFCLELVKII